MLVKEAAVVSACLSTFRYLWKSILSKYLFLKKMLVIFIIFNCGYTMSERDVVMVCDASMLIYVIYQFVVAFVKDSIVDDACFVCVVGAFVIVGIFVNGAVENTGVAVAVGGWFW